MKYNPEIHNRKSIRLKNYDYSQAGAYFITICCENKLNRFGEIIVGAGFTPALFTHEQNSENIKNYDIKKWEIQEKGQPQGITATNKSESDIETIMQLNEYGQIAYNEWIKLNERFQNIELNVFQIMPNHLHGIIILNNIISVTTISNIVGSYKSLVANKCLEIYKTKNEVMGKFWQRNYYEHIIRNEQSYQQISNYIINNPFNWKEDKFYTK